MDDKFEIANAITKVDDTLGLVFGWAVISKVRGEEHYDLQGDHIPETAMLEASTDFMLNKREAKEMHTGDSIGDIVFAWPMTIDIAKAFGIDTETTGLMIAMKPTDPAVLQKFADGNYKGFSIGGKRLEETVVEYA